jgi:hypothetical protein
MLVFMACMMYVTGTYGPLYGAIAMASNAILRYILGVHSLSSLYRCFEGLGHRGHAHY